MQEQWAHKIFGVGEDDFEALALEIFHFQYQHNPVYKAYLQALHIDAGAVHSIDQVPFLPISLFKSHSVQTSVFEPEAVFTSSGTTGSINSRHLVKDLTIYKESITKSFELFYGPVQEWCIAGLLPSYMEQKNSSLAFMISHLVRLSQHQRSDFYLNDPKATGFERLASVLKALEKQKQKTMLIGVTFALLDFAGKFSFPLHFTTVMETGGMKGRREEMIRPQVHSLLQEVFHTPVIHSEYGMTELLSQSYSKGNGIFQCPPWMKVLVRDEEDPFTVKTSGSGAMNVIDLANIYSCSFIATDDAGKIYGDGSFEVLGRLDSSDTRGCSLMVL